MNAINEQELADWLAQHPDFFERHAELLAGIKLVSPHGQRAVSLQERQMEVLRDKHRVLELRLAELLHFGTENDRTQQKLHGWLLRLIALRDAAEFDAVVTEGLRAVFNVPAVAVKVWDGAGASSASFVPDDLLRAYVDSLAQPYCGADAGYGVADWIRIDGAAPASMAVVALRPHGDNAPAAGLLAFGADDARRFQAGIGTDYLRQIGEFASAALARLSA